MTTTTPATDTRAEIVAARSGTARGRAMYRATKG